MFITQLQPLVTSIQALWVSGKYRHAFLSHAAGLLAWLWQVSEAQCRNAGCFVHKHLFFQFTPKRLHSMPPPNPPQDQGLLRQGEKVVLYEGLMTAAAEAGQQLQVQVRGLGVGLLGCGCRSRGKGGLLPAGCM